MAMLTDTQTAHGAEGGFFSRMLTGLTTRYTHYAAYRKCVSELAALSDRELRDLGLHRSMIRSLAYESAYRNI
jgi:uncharacterized protein YjiS (DUF1127 family)